MVPSNDTRLFLTTEEEALIVAFDSLCFHWMTASTLYRNDPPANPISTASLFSTLLKLRQFAQFTEKASKKTRLKSLSNQ